MGAWTEIVDFTFTANETSRAFTGLNITKDDFIKIVFTHVNGSSSGSDIRLFPNTAAGVNGFNTVTNYHNQLLEGNGTSPNASRTNANNFSFIPGSSQNYVLSFLKLSENGKANFFSNEYRTINSSLRLRFKYITSSNLTYNDPITSLTFSSDVSNGLGTGSRIQIYRLDAEKVADFTTTSNSTQVDIPVTGSLDPAITKDSEYLLVADISNPQGSGSVAYLTPNDLTTLTGYYSQDIRATDSTALAARQNTPLFNFLDANERAISYSHIKLSEIGAYTSQNYVIRNLGTSSVRLQNFFISSTSEAITSIIKLNVFTGVSNAIGSGSRFILYKLK
jgi:hypothetical protein